MSGRKRKPRGWRRYLPDWWRWRFTALGLVLLGSFGLGFYLAQLYGEISAVIEQRRAALTSTIYSAPKAVAPGDDVARVHLFERLRHLSYTEVTAVNGPGEFALTPGRLTIYIRPYRLGVRDSPAALVRLNLSGTRVTALSDLFGVALKEALLESEVIGRLMPDAPAERVEVGLDEVPPFVTGGLLATEDRFFYYHPGFDPIRIIEAAILDLRAGRLAQGASTITQQLARTFLPPRRRSFWRKFREAAIAVVLEMRLSKKQILERYINDVPMGDYHGAPIYGLPLAARYLFNKDLRQVTPAEAAMLIGMIRAPTLYDPRRHPAQCQARRDTVLALMKRAGAIDQGAFAAAGAAPIKLAQALGARPAPYFTDYVTSMVGKIPGFDGHLEGVKVYTTLDPELEAIAEKSTVENLERLEREHKRLRRSDDGERLESSLVALDVSSGAVRAMVGGRDYAASQFNRAVMAKRQAGSTFKPVVYLAALDPDRCPLGAPLTLASVLPDRPMSFHGWTPANYEGEYKETVTVASALAESLNVPTAYVGSLLGPSTLIATAHELGIGEQMPAVLPIAIGAGETTLLELASVYQVFAAAGVARPPYAIESVVDTRGHLIFQHTPMEKRLIRPDVAYLMTGALEEVMSVGTGAASAAMGLNFPAAGKTGTTDAYHDAYFIGYTPKLVCGVWVGFDEPQSIGLPGAKAALPAWVNFMVGSAPAEPADFEVPPGIVRATIDPDSGGLATSQCPRRMTVPFLAGSEPTALCGLHGGGWPSAVPPPVVAAVTPGAVSPGTPLMPPATSPAPNFFSAVGRLVGSLFGRR
jgi:penicillin-binding protein 1B